MLEETAQERIVKTDPPKPRITNRKTMTDQHGNPVSVNRKGQYIDGAGRVIDFDEEA